MTSEETALPPTDSVSSTVDDGTGTAPTRGSRRQARCWSRFAIALAVLVVLGGALRIAYVMTVTRHDHHLYDASYYALEAASVAHGDGFVDPFAGIVAPGSKPEPSAPHGPLTTLVLVPAAFVHDFDLSTLLMRFTMVLVGLGAVVVVALLGRELGGDTMGIIAGAIAALDPNLWMNDGLVMSEPLAVLLVAAILLLSYRVMRGPSLRRVVALGAVCGLVILVRAELGALMLLVAVPAIWIGSRRSPEGSTSAVRKAAICVVVALVLVAPWVVFNLTRFQKLTLVSTNDGGTMLASNCDWSYYGPNIGSGSDQICAINPPKGDPSVVSDAYRSRAFHYIGDHLSRWPVVVLARIGRMWSVFHVSQTVGFDVGEGRPRWASYAGILTLYALLAASVVGIVTARRRRIAIWPLLMPILVVTSLMLLVSGVPRYRAAAEPSIVALAAVGIGAVLGSPARRGRPKQPSQGEDGSAETEGLEGLEPSRPVRPGEAGQ